MELMIKNTKYGNIKIDYNKIIGVIGSNRHTFINALKKDNIAYIPIINNFKTKLVSSELSLFGDINEDILQELGLDKKFLNKNINALSSSECRLLNYLIMLLKNKNIIIIDEPFLDIDYDKKKKIISLLKRMIYKTEKTIMLISNDVNIIYELCDKVLWLEDNYYYGNTIDILTDINLLNKYRIDTPNLVEIVNMIRNKNIAIDYSRDINDLIKDVYKCV